MFVKDEEGRYKPTQEAYSRDELISFAKRLVSYRFRRRMFLESPDSVRNYLSLNFSALEREHFWALFLDNRHRTLNHEVLFTGTIDSASVYPRVIAQKALQHNASAIILAHNHPSGIAEPSRADVEITNKVKKALSLLEIRLLDHFIVGGGTVVSLAERGEIV